MSYSIVSSSRPLGSTDEGCPGQWFLTDKHDRASCADTCPSGWVQQIDTDLDVKWCTEPRGPGEEAPSLEEAAQAYEASEAGIGLSSSPWLLAAAGAGVLVLGAGIYLATRET